MLFYIAVTFTASILFGNPQNIAIFYAIDEDWKTIESSLVGNSSRTRNAGITYSRIAHEDMTLFGMRMGSGVIETAVRSQTLLSAERIDLAISIGPIGALDNTLQLNDLVLVSDAIPWQTTQRIESSSPDSFSPLDISPPRGDWQQVLKKYKTSRVASGDVFINDSELRMLIRTSTGANAVDMNLYGLLTALEKQSIPSIHIRIVSDFADETALDDFKGFLNHYLGLLGNEVVAIIKNLPDDPTDPSHYPELRNLFREID